MTEKKWLALEFGDIIYNELDGLNVIVEYPYDKILRGKKYLISCDINGNVTGEGLFDIEMFDRRDWKLIAKRGK